MLKKFLQSAPAQSAIAGLAARYLRLVAATTRWRIENEAGLGSFAAGPPCIVTFWHEALPAMPVFWLRASPPAGAVVLASRHRDGQLIGMVVKHLGLSVISGSTSKGGAGALRALVTALKSGQHVGLTPDGPRGPRRRAAAGATQLAAMTGAAILPCAAATNWAIRLSSWDAMRFPLPFGHGRLILAPLIQVGRDEWQSAIPCLEAALNGAMARAAS